jgi:acyl-CoA dehydrogenase
MNLEAQSVLVTGGASGLGHATARALVDKGARVVIADLPGGRGELAACSTEVEAGQAMLDRAVALHVDGELTAADAARVKLFCTEMQQRVVDRCLQLFGGYGYMMEYPIARLYTDARVARIYAGTSEVMKVIIAKSLGL